MYSRPNQLLQTRGFPCLTTFHPTACSFYGSYPALSITFPACPQAVVHRVAAACGGRLLALSSRSAPLAKPLVLALATCFLCNPGVATPALAAALGAQEQAGRGLEARAGVAEWAVRLAEVVARTEHGLTDPTEAHLAGETGHAAAPGRAWS